MKYTHAFEIAQIAVSELQRRGWKFRDDAVRLAALSAVPFSTAKYVAEEMENTLIGARISLNPNWDGSIA